MTESNLNLQRVGYGPYIRIRSICVLTNSVYICIYIIICVRVCVRWLNQRATCAPQCPGRQTWMNSHLQCLGQWKGVLLGPVKGLVSNRKGFNHWVLQPFVGLFQEQCQKHCLVLKETYDTLGRGVFCVRYWPPTWFGSGSTYTWNFRGCFSHVWRTMMEIAWNANICI